MEKEKGSEMINNFTSKGLTPLFRMICSRSCNATVCKAEKYIWTTLYVYLGFQENNNVHITSTADSTKNSSNILCRWENKGIALFNANFMLSQFSNSQLRKFMKHYLR